MYCSILAPKDQRWQYRVRKRVTGVGCAVWVPVSLACDLWRCYDCDATAIRPLRDFTRATPVRRKEVARRSNRSCNRCVRVKLSLNLHHPSDGTDRTRWSRAWRRHYPDRCATADAQMPAKMPSVLLQQRTFETPHTYTHTHNHTYTQRPGCSPQKFSTLF